jgi:hypothetical protein
MTWLCNLISTKRAQCKHLRTCARAAIFGAAVSGVPTGHTAEFASTESRRRPGAAHRARSRVALRADLRPVLGRPRRRGRHGAIGQLI